MWSKSPLLVFIISLILLLTLSLGLHFVVLEYLNITFTISDLFMPYSANFFLASIITIGLYLLRVKQAANLGFIFMGSSFFKFLVFFLVFYPIYTIDGELSPVEFGWFFIPYAVSLTFETNFLVRILNEMD